MDALLHRGPDRMAVLRSFVTGLSGADADQLRAWLEARDAAHLHPAHRRRHP